MIDFENLDPARVCEALAPLIADDRRARIDEVLAARLGSLVLVLENLHDPHNGAAALRSCEAAGLTTVHAVEGIEPFRFSPKVTQGCERWLEIHRHKTTAATVTALREQGFRLAAAVPGASATLADFHWAQPYALWIGNEHDGLTPTARVACDVEFSLPMSGMTRSLNLSVASALAVFEAASRRRAAMGRPGDLDPEEQARLRARWYIEDVRGAEAVLRRVGII